MSGEWFVVGLMSGTSADGIDLAAVRLREAGSGYRLVEVSAATFPYRSALRKRLLAIAEGEAQSPATFSRLNVELGELFAHAVIRFLEAQRIDRARVDLIASHGHTIFHGPPGSGERAPSTWQIGEPAVIAALTGVPTVADFRPADVAAGGQGAPLAPYAHAKLFHSAGVARAVLNLGGIANVTYLPRNGRTGEVIAFDIGPANMVIDACAAAASGGKLRFDRDGRLARRGRVDATVLQALERHPYLRRKPPKSTGREEFGAPFFAELERLADAAGASPADRVATATAFTAATVADAYRRFLEPLGGVDETILCGGGAHNPALVEALTAALGGKPLRLVDDLGVSTDALEAVAFAVLGVETIRGRPANLPAVTGAGRAVVLGKIIPGDELHFRRLLRKARPARA